MFAELTLLTLFSLNGVPSVLTDVYGEVCGFREPDLRARIPQERSLSG